MRKIDMVLVSGEFFAMDELKNDVILHKSSSIIINYNRYKSWFSYIPPGVNVKRQSKNFLITKNERLNYYISPLILLVNNLILFMQISKLCLKYRPDVVIVDGYILPVLIWVLKRIHWCKRSVYITGDWHPANKGKKRLVSYIGNVLVFPCLDYLSCKSTDVVINYSDRIAEARQKFWKKKIARLEKTIYFPLKIKTDKFDLKKKHTKIAFIGIMREDSGLDIVIQSLNELRKLGDISLKIIGGYTHGYEYFKRLAKDHGVEPFVEFMGFVERDRFADALSDCFCGVNLVKNENNYTSYTYPGKLGDYLQYLLPPIITVDVGYAKETVHKHELGLIINPTCDDVVKAINKLYNEQQHYRENILRYIKSIPRLDIQRLVECENTA